MTDISVFNLTMIFLEFRRNFAKNDKTHVKINIFELQPMITL